MNNVLSRGDVIRPAGGDSHVQVVDIQEVVDLKSVVDVVLNPDFLDLYRDEGTDIIVQGVKEFMPKMAISLKSGIDIEMVVKELLGIVELKGEYSDEVKLSISLAIALRNYGIFRDPISEADCRSSKFLVFATIVHYLEGMKKAKTLVVERDYIDRDYLDDYARYYSRCFENYERKCTRLHFFAGASAAGGGGFSQKELEDRIVHPDVEADDGRIWQDELQEQYLGFVVVRPLVSALVGRTYLVANDIGDFRYCALKDFDVSFFGRRLTVKCMPFLQQDKATAACATCALWSCAQVTSKLFAHKPYCPGCITTMSLQHGMSTLRKFPNHGLEAEDMLYAIRNADLDPIYFDVENLPLLTKEDVVTCFLGHIYAYLAANIPLVLAGDLYEHVSQSEVLDLDSGWKGRHAVAINGYHMGQSVGCADRHLSSSRIDQVLVHDDQIGPYTAMEVGKDLVRLQYADNESPAGLMCERWKCKWKGSDGKAWDFVPKYLIIPSYHKIRVGYAEVYQKMKDIDKQIERIILLDAQSGRSNNLEGGTWAPEWEIKVQTLDAFKKEIRNDRKLHDAIKLQLVTESYPKFLWIMTAKNNREKQLTIWVDATDPGRVSQGVKCIPYTEDMMKILLAISKDDDRVGGFAQSAKSVVAWFKAIWPPRN